MMVRILLITHENIGAELLKTVTQTFETLPIAIDVLPIYYGINRDTLLTQLQEITKNTAGENLLILTDMYGSTPCNLALLLQDQANISIVSGLNLPMLIKVLNYPDLCLNELTQKALSGGKKGVVNCLRLPTVCMENNL
jgi:mannose PTS system EIIA component